MIRGLVVLGFGLLVALCGGLLARRKFFQSLAFSLYVAAATVFTGLGVFWPELNTPEAFMVKQGVYDSLLFGMALEISCRAFAAFGGIASRARGLLALIVFGSSLAILCLTPPNQQYTDLGRYQPGITTAGLWCLTFVGLLIVWYQIPVPPFTRSIILGYVPYLLVFVVFLDMIARRGWGAINGLNLAKVLAYDMVAAYWVYAAWRKD